MTTPTFQAFSVEILVDYGHGEGLESDGGVEFETALDYAYWLGREKSESMAAIEDGDYMHKTVVLNGRMVWSL